MGLCKKKSIAPIVSHTASSVQSLCAVNRNNLLFHCVIQSRAIMKAGFMTLCAETKKVITLGEDVELSMCACFSMSSPRNESQRFFSSERERDGGRKWSCKLLHFIALCTDSLSERDRVTERERERETETEAVSETTTTTHYSLYSPL